MIKLTKFTLPFLVVILFVFVFLYTRRVDQESLFIKIIKKDSSKSIVVSYCGENLDWLRDFPDYLIFIYTKCEKDTQNVQYLENVKVITLNNSGGCDHTYLYHIVNNWDTLTDYVIFTTGNPFGKREHCYEKMRLENTFFCIGHISYDYMESYKLSLNEYNPVNSKDKIPFIKSKYKNFEEFITINFGEDAFDRYKKFNKSGYFGIFSVSKEQIKLNSKEVYEKLLREVDIGNNNEVGHFIERMWMFLMYNKIILNLN